MVQRNGHGKTAKQEKGYKLRQIAGRLTVREIVREIENDGKKSKAAAKSQSCEKIKKLKNSEEEQDPGPGRGRKDWKKMGRRKT